jgi:hypothetical protein
VSDASLLVNATVTPTPLPLVHPVMLKHIVNWGIYERRRYRELLEKTRATE